MNWGVVWYIDFDDWSVISPCTEAIQTRIKFSVVPRSAHVVPIYKGGSRQCPNSYRPISFDLYYHQDF